jgi:glyoxylase-like metal-dependent hydrolase (beta-lactamase superfamily II)
MPSFFSHSSRSDFLAADLSVAPDPSKGAEPSVSASAGGNPKLSILRDSSGRSPNPKAPRPVLEPDASGYVIYAFPPNRQTLGGTAYLIVDPSHPAAGQPPHNLLIDCPAWTEEHQEFIQQQGGIRHLILTHRGAIAPTVAKIQQQTGCEVIIQEQEAYLLPGQTVTPFQKEMALGASVQVIWTPGHSPGASCVYASRQGGVLFSGRTLLPTSHGQLEPLRLSKTFHWPRQLRSIQRLRDRFTADTLHYICPGANTGFLRGRRAIAQGYEALVALDLDAYRQKQPGL